MFAVLTDDELHLLKEKMRRAFARTYYGTPTSNELATVHVDLVDEVERRIFDDMRH